MSDKPLLIDTDVHNNFAHRRDLLPYLPRVWHQQWLEDGVGSGLKPWSPIGVTKKDSLSPNGGSFANDPHTLLEDLVERYEIDYAILTGSVSMIGISIHFDADYANAVASAWNDYLIDKWLSVSPKFKGSIIINNNDPMAAAREIDRLGSHPGMVQVMMPSASRTLYGQRFFHPIYEAAERNGLPVAVHPGLDFGPPTPSGFPSRYIEFHNILPINFMAHINSLVCEGVFEKFPNLKFIAVEGGISWVAHLMWRMDKNYKALRDQVPWLKKLPSEYIREHVKITTQPIEEPEKPGQLAELLQMIRAEEMIMFATDYPHWDFDNPKAVLNEFPRGMRELVSGLNAARLYGLEAPVIS
jgi:predicted TIM-barrel fold metal-dependent hydrolase